MKFLLLYIFSLIFTSKSATLKNVTTDNISRILIIRPDERLGNTIITTALAGELRSLYPTAEIDFLVSEKYSPLVANNSRKINILAFQKRSLFTSPGKWLNFFIRLRKKKYDISIDATHEHAFSTTGMLISLFCNAKLRIGHKRSFFDRGYTHAVEISESDIPEIKRKQRLLLPLKPENRLLPSPKLWHAEIDKSSEEKINDFLKRKELQNSELVFLWPGARKEDRRFEADFYIELVKNVVVSPDHKLVVIWGPGEYQTAKTIVEQTGSILAPATNVVELTALLHKGKCFIGNDTGPLHLANAAGLATFSLVPDAYCLRWVYTNKPHSAIVVNGNKSAIREKLENWLSKTLKDTGR